MKRLIVSMTIILFCGMSIFAQNKTNISVPLRLTTQISTAEHRTVPQVVVNSDILDREGKLFVREGSPVKIDYTIRKKRSCGRPGTVKIVPVYTFDAQGDTVYLKMTEGEFYVKGDSRVKASVGCGVGFGLTVLPGFGFFFLCMKGFDTVVPEGTTIPTLTATYEEISKRSQRVAKK